MPNLTRVTIIMANIRSITQLIQCFYRFNHKNLVFIFVTFVSIEMLQQLLSQGETVVALPNMVTLYWHEFKYILVLYSQLYKYLFIIHVLFKCHF